MHGLGFIPTYTQTKHVLTPPTIVFSFSISVQISPGNIPSASGSSNFFQTSPSLDNQARVIAQLLTQLDWFYTGIIYSASTYGKTGYEAFVNVAKELGVCIGPAREIPSNPVQTDFDEILLNMYDTTDLNVIVTFVDEYHVRRLLVTQHIYGFNRFSWVGTETWSVDPGLFVGFEDQAAGSLAIVPSIGDMVELQQYLTNVPVQGAIDRNPWLAGALVEIFPCKHNITKRSPVTRDSLACVDLGDDGLGNLITRKQYNDDIFHVINAFFALTYGADQLRQALCNETQPMCTEYFTALRSGPEFYEAVANVTFTTGGQQFAFTNRSGPPTFTIQNFQHQIGSRIQFVNVS